MSTLASCTAALSVVCTVWSVPVHALPTTADYMRVMDGAYVLSSGLVVGAVKAELHYNINPTKLNVQRVPGFDFNERLVYAPIHLYQDQFWMDVTYTFAPYAPGGFENKTISIAGIPIDTFEVRNGVLDELIVRASGTLGQTPFSLLFDAWTNDVSALSSASLNAVLMGSAERLFDCPGGPNDVCALFPNPPGFPEGYGYIEGVGPPTEVYLAPAPGTLALFAPALLALLTVSRGRHARADQNDASCRNISPACPARGDQP